MKKATVIIIAAIYVASIVIVGVFGLQALIYIETLPVTDIILPTQIEGVDVQVGSDGRYRVGIHYHEDLVIPIEYTPYPADAPAEIKVEITYQSSKNNDVAELTHEVGYFLKFNKKGQVNITFTSTDNRKFSKTLIIVAA